MEQKTLDLVPVKMQEVDSISMGVLPNGETFLSPNSDNKCDSHGLA